MRALILLLASLPLHYVDVHLRTSWQVNLGPVGNAPVSVSVCQDGSVLSAERDMPLVRVDAGGLVRSTDSVIRGGPVICTTDGFVELQGPKVVIRQWTGRVREYSLPVTARSGVQLPTGDLLLLTERGPMLLADNGRVGVPAAWGGFVPEQADAILAVNRDTVAVIYPRRTEVEFREAATLRLASQYRRPGTLQFKPLANSRRDVTFGAAFLPDGRLAVEMRPANRTLLMMVSTDRKTHSDLDITSKGYGLLHGSGSDGCLVFSAFHPERGKALRKVCVTDSE